MAELIYEGHDLDVLSNMPNYYDWIMSAFARHIRGKVAEYGAGTGTVSNLIEPRADSLTLVEPSQNLVAVLGKRFLDNSKIKIVSALVEDHARQMADQTYDTIVMVNVLEHVEHDAQTLKELVRILRPGGHLLLFVPALQGLMSKIDLIHGHFRRYHRPDLMAKAEQAGGEILFCRYFDAFGVLPWYALNKMMGSTDFNPSMVRINDRFVVPISRAVESVVPPPFGKNLIMAVRKPANVD